LRIPDQLIDGLASNKLSEQDGSPHPAVGGDLKMAEPRRSIQSFPVQDAFDAVYRVRVS
jgi:hypothetical protein